MTEKEKYEAILGICDKFINFYSKQEFSIWDNNWVVYDKQNKRVLTFDEDGIVCLRFLVECPPAFSLKAARLCAEKVDFEDYKGKLVVTSVITRLEYYQRLKKTIKTCLCATETD